ncbi:hypothetical protein G6F61_014847 [Rhizopus arrhizus]|nr:hypothetical protein G6F61_014847 [Rhizopus arrhizus]
MCTPRRSADSCWPYGWPPYTGSTRKPGIFDEYDWNASATWMASSRVGARIRAWGLICCRSMLDSTGSANAAVLPVPVWAWPSTSRPSSSAGMVAAWIGDGVS